MTDKTPRERMSLAELIRENKALRRELESVIRTAAANEAIWRHMVEIEKVLFRTRQFDLLASQLLEEIRRRFDLDGVVLAVGHPDVLERFFPQLANGDGARVLWAGDGACIVSCALPDDPQGPGEEACGPRLLDETAVAALMNLPEDFPPIGSAALVPLRIHDLFFGFLLLASRDPHHYRPGDGTELLEQMGHKVALCMENCLAYERAKELSDRDEATGLLNFFQIHSVLEREFRRARRKSTDLSVLAVDLEFVDEAFGHEDMVGPVLNHVGELLRRTFPDGEGFIGRYGSVEFLVVCPYADEREAQVLRDRLMDLIRRSPFRRQRTVLLIRPRIGVATLTGTMERAQDLLDAVQKSLCQAKAAQRLPQETESAGRS
ncbi:diguanylate cyclase (GGDEF) domain-containing protein [Desulfacinum hydrothermale DSM 13146]|uniref:diguanylate cyclase n=1 Tax=Desulfacinum hydrothermale DSM 13146 TaxID=1121390 RepID=A0A1W1X0R9_9BACT|nr:DUF484 family protein [Desulfacinum hydrothermale]SMC17318.1 diguanylate cyclase (GGDEF) domain-containing protein [Desulfacinum hydrothermale DSM 13146]